eukprot:11294910-Karenia_brevis.AAC.1
MHARSLTFAIYGDSYDLDPYIAIYGRRFTMLRKMVEKHPSIVTLASHIYATYCSMEYVGTNTNQDFLAKVVPAPLPGAPGRQHHKHAVAPRGPI